MQMSTKQTIGMILGMIGISVTTCIAASWVRDWKETKRMIEFHEKEGKEIYRVLTNVCEKGA